MKRIAFFALFLVFAFQALAQKGSGNENIRYLFTQGNLMMNEHLSDSSLKTFLLLYKADTENANVCYFIGQLYLGTPANKYKALSYLQKSVKHISSNYTPDNPYEKSAPAPAYYYYARALHINYQFNDAIYSFNIFKKMLSKTDARQKDCDYWINCCSNGIELVKTPVDCKITNLGDSVNGKYPDYNPAVTADEQEILFTSRRIGGMNDSNSEKDTLGFYNEQMWISYAKTDNSWTKAKNMGNSVNTGGNNASISVSPDGQSLIFCQAEADGLGNLYVSRLHGLVWGGGRSIDSTAPGTINNGSASPGASLSPDGRTLVFASNRAGGMGGTDLYKITISDSGKWSQPVNLGQNINTEYDEAAPFIHADDSTLFFSSKGHNTMGGFDVFMSQLDTGATWGKPVNMGYPINSTDDDLYFNVSPDGRRAYYSTVRMDAIGEKDIYEVTFNTPLPVKRVAVLAGYIRSSDNKPIPNDIMITTSLSNGKSIIRTRTNPKTGKFLQILRPNETYNVVIATQGKQVFNQNFYLPADSSYYSLSRAFFRTSIILGDTTNVFVPKPKVPLDSMAGSILLNDAPSTPLANMQIQLIDDKGNVIQTTLTDKHGHFTFYKLPANKSYQLKIDLKDTKLRHLKKLLLANSKGKVVRNFDQNAGDSYFYHDLPADLNELSEISRVAVVPPKIIRIAAEDADFVEYFKYNADQNIQKASNFIALVNKIKSRLMHDTVTVVIESSASKVPTSAQFENSNRVLAEKRGLSEKTTILNALKRRQAKRKELKFDMKAEVQGPEYAKDAQDQDKYQKYQYVKVFVH